MLRNHDNKTTKCVHALIKFFKACSLPEAPYIFGTRLLSRNLKRPKSRLSAKLGFAFLYNGIQLKELLVGFVLFLFDVLFSFLEHTDNITLRNSGKEGPLHSSLVELITPEQCQCAVSLITFR